MTTEANKLDKLERAAVGAQLLGDVFAWGTSEGVRCTPEELARFARDAGLDPRHLPLTVDREAAARRAVAEATQAAGVTAKTTIANPGAVVWAVVDSSVDQGAQIGDKVGVLANRILFRKLEGDLRVEHDSPLAADVLSRFTAHVGAVGWRTIRDAVVHYLADWSAVRLWGTGAQYFVPLAHSTELRSLRAFLRAVGAEAGCIPIPDCDDARDAVGTAVRRQMAEEIDRLRDEVAKWRTGDGSPRQSTIEGRVKSYQQLREEIAGFSAALALGMKDLERDLTDLIRDASTLLAGGPAPAPAPAPAPRVVATEVILGAGPAVEIRTLEPGVEVLASTSGPRPPARPSAPPPERPLGELSDRQLRKLASDRGIEARGLGRDELLGMLAG